MMYSKSARLNCLIERISFPYQGAVLWSPKGRWGFLALVGMFTPHPSLRECSKTMEIIVESAANFNVFL
jgi:hypothetical protein